MEAQARKVIADIYALSNTDALESSTIKDYAATWLTRKALESNERSHQRYTTAIEHFLKYQGSKANRDLAHLSVKEITGLRDSLAKELSPNSANYTVKILRAMLNQARRDGFVERNEASRVPLIQQVQKQEGWCLVMECWVTVQRTTIQSITKQKNGLKNESKESQNKIRSELTCC